MFKAGVYKQQYQYKSFTPSPVNRLFVWEDPQIDVLLEEAHRRSHDRGEHTQADEYVREGVCVGGERTGEHRPVDARHAVQTELDHRPGEQNAHRRRGDRVGVGQPEVEGHDGGLHVLRISRRHRG